MSARVKAAVLIVAVAFMIFVGSKLGNAVESMGQEIAANRTAAMGR